MQLVRTRVMTIEDNAWSLQHLWRQVHEKKIRAGARARLTPSKKCGGFRFMFGMPLYSIRFHGMVHAWVGQIVTFGQYSIQVLYYTDSDTAHCYLTWFCKTCRPVPTRTQHTSPAPHNHLAGVCETVDFGEHSGAVVVTVHGSLMCVSCA